MWGNISDSDEPKISHDLGRCGMTSCDFGGTDIKDIGVEWFLNEPGSVKVELSGFLMNQVVWRWSWAVS